MESILVTGGAGFIGSNIADALISLGHRVIVLDDLSTGKQENIAYLQQQGRGAITFYRGTILDADLVKFILREHAVTRISHQAACPSVTQSILDPVSTSSVNIIGTINLFNLAAQQGCRKIVFASSCSIYGDTERMPINELVPFRSKSPYAASKAAKEMLAGVFSGLYDMDIIGLRYFNVYGRRQDPTSGYAAAIPNFIAKALRGETITIDGDGKQTRDFVYIDDVVQANIKALMQDNVGSMVFNIAYGEQTSIIDLARIIADVVGSSSQIVHGAPRTGDIRNSLADINSAKKYLQFEPRYDIRCGLEETVTWYREAYKHEACAQQVSL
jgi:nucleoside-diphosphate-sugar epimerase